MLKGIPASISPELLVALHQMGHGDQLALADAHFPAHSLHHRVIRADGLLIAPLLSDILHLLELDGPKNPLMMMAVDPGFVADPEIEADYLRAARHFHTELEPPLRLARADFYNTVRTCFAVVITGDARPYGNLVIRKGVTLSPVAK